ncbi:phage tail sheath protein FI [Allocatelliglobosispora scoriae]|uniref:Phage tail sheath protein FI n=1 Tax=Allocatelliglobosispora scoriae TaxID=643052 RepID=A0A841C1L8_9ACTN|nr:phage tail sheath C-terminal domain-containing protein [Allocatelliglobosispora scoriae]MBB5872952.1 phage tail sheath protein FI [Allocatelliglobosispora scoriae]
MPMYSSPGIYVEEVSGGSRPIESVGTSTAGFVGTAPLGSARRHEAVAINSWSEFLRVFVGDATVSTPLSRAVYGFFDNGGGRCYVVNIPQGEPLAGKGRQRSGLRLLEAIDEVAIVAAPGYTDALSYEDLLAHCELMGDRMAILDGPEQVGDVEQLTRVGTGTAPAKPKRAATDKPADGETAPAEESPGLRPRQSDYGTFYVPWLVVRDSLTGEVVSTPPSGHVAGVWARTDTLRGVHKAPANEAVRGAVDLSYRVTKVEQDILNPAGVNCIRHFPAEGIRIWGARTLAASASEWRYLNVRRLFNMLKESIGDGTRWIVFEPNDNLLWKSIRRDIDAFLTRVWRDGALQGRSPQEAFFVKCDEETNPAEVRDAGQVVTLIGVAPVKPAEFVIFKISQSAGVGGDQAGA